MPSQATVAAYKLIRTLWPQSSIYDELFDGSPTLGIFNKDTTFTEQYRQIGVGYGAPQGIGPDFGIAKMFKSPSKAVEFQLATVPYYGAFSIDGALLRKAKYGRNKALIVDPLKRESKNIMRQAKNDLSSYIHGNGGGALAQLTSGTTVSSQIGTLRAGADRRRILPEMNLWFSTADGTSGAVKTGYVHVSSIGGTQTAPTFTTDMASLTAGCATVAASDYVFRAGVFGNIMDGLESWGPNHNGSPSAFRGVTRTLYPEMLAGWQVDGTKMGPRQRMLTASIAVSDAGFTPDTYLMSSRNWGNAVTELQSSGQLRYTKVPAAKIGSFSSGIEYEGIEFIGPRGRLQVLADPWMPDNVERCFDRSVYTLASTGELIHWDDDVGPDNPMVEEAADAREVRLVGDISFYTEAPGAACRVAVTP